MLLPAGAPSPGDVLGARPDDVTMCDSRQAELGTFGPASKALGPEAPPAGTAMADTGEAVDDALRPVCGIRTLDAGLPDRFPVGHDGVRRLLCTTWITLAMIP